MDVKKYLLRLGIDADEANNIKVDLSSLKMIQEHHTLNVPWENLDIVTKTYVHLKE